MRCVAPSRPAAVSMGAFIVAGRSTTTLSTGDDRELPTRAAGGATRRMRRARDAPAGSRPEPGSSTGTSAIGPCVGDQV